MVNEPKAEGADRSDGSAGRGKMAMVDPPSRRTPACQEERLRIALYPSDHRQAGHASTRRANQERNLVETRICSVRDNRVVSAGKRTGPPGAGCLALQGDRFIKGY